MRIFFQLLRCIWLGVKNLIILAYNFFFEFYLCSYIINSYTIQILKLKIYVRKMNMVWYFFLFFEWIKYNKRQFGRQLILSSLSQLGFDRKFVFECFVYFLGQCFISVFIHPLKSFLRSYIILADEVHQLRQRHC